MDDLTFNMHPHNMKTKTSIDLSSFRNVMNRKVQIFDSKNLFVTEKMILAVQNKFVEHFYFSKT